MTERFMTIIGLSSKSQNIDFEDLSHATMELGGGRSYKIQILSEDETSFPNLIQCNGFEFALLFVNTPIPANALSEAYEESAVIWPEAIAEFSPHRSHIAISTLGGSENRKHFLEAALTLTIIAGAFVQVTDALGAYWPQAESLTPPQSILEASKTIFQGEPPIDQWVRLSLRPGNNRAIGIFTKGLLPFVGREIEFSPTPGMSLDVMMDRINSLSQYLISNGLVVRDNDTVGVSDNEYIRVIYGASRMQPGTPVLTLRIEQNEI